MFNYSSPKNFLYESPVTKNLLIIAPLLISFLLSHSLSEARQRVVAVQSIRIAPYEEAIKSFESTCDSKVKRLVVSELKGADVTGKIRQISPDMVLAVGMKALSGLKVIKNIPIVYLMVLNPHSILSGEENITGVSMNIPPEKQLHIFREAIADLKIIGLVYDPARTRYLVEKAQDAAEKVGITLIARQVRRSMDVPLPIRDMRGKIDAFWMLPDLTVITPETVEFLLLFSLENTIPILAFAEKYVEFGALMSIGIDSFDLGVQAGEMANAILSGMDVIDVHRVDARKAVLSINLKVASKMGIRIDEKIIRKARVIK
jgi:putative ABC transport system substrate-binding protein